MKNNVATFLILVFIIVVFFIGGAIFTVDETQQAIVTQFGEPMGPAITQAGLYFKIPLIQKVNYFEKRIMEWDGDPNQIPTLDKRYIWVDTTARWRINDALKFMQSMGSERAAQSRLADIIDAATRDVISGHNLIETVSNSNELIDRYKERAKAGEALDEFLDENTFDRVKFGRVNVTKAIFKRTNEIVPSYGIELIDIRIKSVTYVQEVRRKVYDRMIAERKRAAELFRSEGQGKKAEIEGLMGKELQDIQSNAYRQAQEIMGKADAEAIRIYAEAFSKDPAFYAFLKTLDTYRYTVNAETTLILTTEGEFYKYLKSGDTESLKP
ncbi:MAG: HflC protein [Omnitrophica WOR_2 bacterium GWA2_47_8]|nr:MAG: HflC protein [Omnitrophica WOR_2 bacterium GWA2_47_8]